MRQLGASMGIAITPSCSHGAEPRQDLHPEPVQSETAPTTPQGGLQLLVLRPPGEPFGGEPREPGSIFGGAPCGPGPGSAILGSLSQSASY